MGFNAKQCPQSAEVVREFRAVFGDDVRVVYIKENEFVHGTDERERDRRFNELGETNEQQQLK